MQHIYAGLFSGVVTLLLGAAILYFDYGFWRDTYHRDEVLVEEKGRVDTLGDEVPSPSAMFSTFFKEAKEKMDGISINPKDALKSTEIYSKDVESQEEIVP